MDNIDEIWKELRFEVGIIGNNFIPKDKKEVRIGMGNRNADILFIGNDFNLYEDENYKVASGSSGEFLVKLLDIAEISAEMYYVTTLTKRPVKIKIFNDEDKKRLLDLLLMQIALISPKIIVFLGKDIAQMIENTNIDFEKERGKFKNWRGEIKTYLTYEVETVIKARADSGKKSIIATNFWNDIKNIRTELINNE